VRRGLNNLSPDGKRRLRHDCHPRTSKCFERSSAWPHDRPGRRRRPGYRAISARGSSMRDARPARYGSVRRGCSGPCLHGQSGRELPEHFRVSSNHENALSFCFIEFSSREPVSTSLENTPGGDASGTTPPTLVAFRFVPPGAQRFTYDACPGTGVGPPRRGRLAADGCFADRVADPRRRFRSHWPQHEPR